MGDLPSGLTSELENATLRYVERAMPAGEYRGWLASPSDDPGAVVGGAGVQLRRVLPFPQRRGPRVGLALGRQAVVLNVYTEPAWRRQGVARALMDCVIRWAREERLDSLVLHASVDGRPLYEQLGFVPTNEMRLAELSERTLE